MKTDKTVVSFSFRTNKDTGEKRPTVEIVAEVPSKEGIVELLQSTDPTDKAAQELVMDAVVGVITPHIRSYVENDLEFSQERYDELLASGKVSLEYIANLPKAERNVLSKEDLEAFATDYVDLMPAISGKEISRVQLTAQVVVGRFKRIAGDPAAISVVKNNLMQFIEGAPEEVVNAHSKVLTWALAKLDELAEMQVNASAL